MVLVTARHAALATYTPRDKQTRFSKRNKDKRKTKQTISDSNSNLAKSMTHHNQTKELTTWFLNKKQWYEKLLNIVWAYRTTTRTSTGMTLYSLVYGGEAVLPLEVQIASLRVAIHEKLIDDEAVKLRLNELDDVEEK
jgi:hypothetical protein